jgi:GxxExxY protein
MERKYELKRKDLIYPELSYQIIGILFNVYNDLGGGCHERYYQKAVALGLKECSLTFREQVYLPLNFRGIKVGNYYLDFLIENKIILEIKKGEKFTRKNIEQVYNYLKVANLKLGIIANFTKTGLRFKRILNIK